MYIRSVYLSTFLILFHIFSPLVNALNDSKETDDAERLEHLIREVRGEYVLLDEKTHREFWTLYSKENSQMKQLIRDHYLTRLEFEAELARCVLYSWNAKKIILTESMKSLTKQMFEYQAFQFSISKGKHNINNEDRMDVLSQFVNVHLMLEAASKRSKKIQLIGGEGRLNLQEIAVNLMMRARKINKMTILFDENYFDNARKEI